MPIRVRHLLSLPKLSNPTPKHLQDQLSEGRESNSADRGIFDDQAADFSHLLDDPGLGITREEVETLFDIVDEGDREAAKRIVSEEGGNTGDDGGTTGKRHLRPGVRRADRGLILFLRKRGLRRCEYIDVAPARRLLKVCRVSR